MRKIVNILGYGLLALLIIILGLVTYVKTMLPNVGPAPEMNVEISNEKLIRGTYVAQHVMVCMDCHSTRDWSSFSGPFIKGTEGKGGEVYDQKMGFPGKYVANNITPYHLGDWTDGEIFRAITSGVSKDGRALFPIMPHHNFGQLDQDDIEAVIAYIRSLEPIKHQTEPSQSDFPMSIIIHTLPKKAAFKKRPSRSDSLHYGKYLVTAAGCMDCHTKQEKGTFVGEPFSGGFEFEFPDGTVVVSSNLTPDKQTGIGSWTQAQFVTRFKLYTDSAYVAPKVGPGDFQTVMPWTMYAGMNEEDLTAIFTYLQSIAPVENKVEKFTALK